MLFINIVKAFLVRVVLLVHSILAVWRAVSISNNTWLWLLAVADVAFIIEALITIIKRKGMEYKWFCPCFFFYLGGTLPSIWLLELDRRERYVAVKQGVNNATATESLAEIYPGVSIPISLPADTWVLLIEQFLLYFMIVGRWLLPRGTISRNELSQLLFVFIGIASDITEFFTLFDEDVVRKNLELTYAILIIWTISLVQFCFVLTATKNSNKPRVALHDTDEETGPSTSKRRRKGGCEKCVSSEVWSTMVTMCMQDGPFLTIRLFVIITYHLVNYAIIFFTAKNALVMLLLLYRLIVICGQKNPESDRAISEIEIYIPDAVNVSNCSMTSSPAPNNIQDVSVPHQEKINVRHVGKDCDYNGSENQSRRNVNTSKM
ncbi:transmembrane protein 26-like [Saccostrea cucullata]|uniref:transmembrane protein 26-like n=1 Tax=Saccostrea cuccullata TaxID=36930 RepID=UPI002ED553AC